MRRRDDNQALSVPEMLSILGLDFLPLDTDGTIDELRARLIDEAGAFIDEAGSLATTDDQTGWPTDETLAAFLVFLRSRGIRMLARPAGLYT